MDNEPRIKFTSLQILDSSALTLETILDNRGSLSRIWEENSVLKKFNTITGNKIMPFFIDKKYDLDINTSDDLEYLDFLLKRKKVKLESILKKPFRK